LGGGAVPGYVGGYVGQNGPRASADFHRGKFILALWREEGVVFGLRLSVL
jgi:hypothetical protein